MPPEFSRITSFHLDLDDWYSCHTSDDEAYQDALERNSVASFYTARGAASTNASIVFTSVGLGSPSRLADADQALAEMVPEPLGDARPQHEPPELDEEDAPVLKRTRSICAGPLPSAYSPTRASTPSTKAKPSARQLWPRRGQPPLRPVATSAPSALTTKPAQPATPSAGPLRASISFLPDGLSVQLQLVPAIFCFGDVPLPVPGGTTDYSAVLMGPDGDIVNSPDDGKLAEQYSPQPPRLDLEEPTTPKAEPMSKLDADCAVKLITRPRGTTPYKPGSAAKDQTKAKHQAGEGKERKPGGGFPGSFMQRLFSGLRHSIGGGGGDRTQGVPPPATVRELGLEILTASAATTAAELASVAQLIPVVAGYVQAAPAGAAANAAPAPAALDALNSSVEAATMDEATAAAQRLSAEIFRNVLRTSAEGAATPKTLLSPRDTAFPPPESRTTQRDQMATPVPPAVKDSRQAAPTSVTGNQLQSPGGGPLASLGGEAALALLVGLAADASGGAAEPPETPTSARSSDPLAKKEKSVAAERDGLLTPNLSVEALDCGGLPELERCDSPVTVGVPLALAPASNDTATEAISTESPELAESAETPAAPLLPAVIASPAVPAVAAAAVEASSPATASPRTVSKRAYGTVARLVKKMAPSFRDSTVMSMSANSAQASMCAIASAMPLAVAAGGEVPSDEEGVLVADEAAACLVTVPWAGNADAGTAKRSPAKSESTEAGGGGGAAPADKDEPEAAQAAHGGEPAGQLRGAAAEPTAGAAAPALFVFGQEQPKAAKPAKTRSAPKATGSAATCEDGAAPSEAAGRKRKGGDEILPNAKVPVTAERTSSSDSQDGLTPASPAEQHSTVAPPPPASGTYSAATEPQATDASFPSPQADAVATEVPSGNQVAAVAAAETPVAVTGEVLPLAVANPEAHAPAAAAAVETPVRAEELESVPAAQPAAADVEDAVAETDVEPIVETAAGFAAEAPATKSLVALNDAPAPDPELKSAADGVAPAPAAAPADVYHSPTAAQKQEPALGSCGGSSSLANPSTVVTTTTEDAAPAAANATSSSTAAPEISAAAATATTTAAAVVQLPEPAPALQGTLEVTEKKAPAAHSGAASAPLSSSSSMQVAVAAHVQEAAASPSCNKPQEVVTAVAKQEAAAAAKAIEATVSEAPAPTGEAFGTVAAAPEVAPEVGTAAAPVVTERAAKPQPPNELPPAEAMPEKPSEGGKHKRRGSFAFFSCFRA